MNAFEQWLNDAIEKSDETAIGWATWLVDNTPFMPQQAKDIFHQLIPYFAGQSAWPFPTQWTSWQFFTGEVNAKQSVLEELLDLVGVTLAQDKGHFYVQSAKHPNEIYKCEFSLNRMGYAYGLKVSKILRFLSKLLKKLQGAEWVKKAAAALSKFLLRAAKYSKRLDRAIDGLPKGAKDTLDKVIGEANAVLDGWGGQGPLQNIRRSVFNHQAPINELGDPTGLFGPLFLVDVGVTILGQLKLILTTMGGPIHERLGWMPFAYRYFGASFGYGIQLSADVGLNIAFGEVHTITKYDARTGKSSPVKRPS